MKAERDRINPSHYIDQYLQFKKGLFNCKCNVLTEKIDLTQRNIFLSKDMYTCEAIICGRVGVNYRQQLNSFAIQGFAEIAVLDCR